MTAAVALCWLAVGLLSLANRARLVGVHRVIVGHEADVRAGGWPLFPQQLLEQRL